MGNRDYKEFAADECYHIYNRGNGKMDIFRNTQDYLNFLQRLFVLLEMPRGALGIGSEVSTSKLRLRLNSFDAGTFSLMCFCIMPNHFHLIIRQNGDIPISKLILRLATSYSMYFNSKYTHVGHVFQDRFKAVHIENDRYLRHLSAYIHLNPKVAGLVKATVDWRYSSYPEYICTREDAVCKKDVILDQFSSSKDYQRFVENNFDDIKLRERVASMIIDE
ncbi:MAG: transposase [bacterium]|nr:transposase [bacterium]